MIGATGPNVSRATSSQPAGTWSSTAGASSAPSRSPPYSSCAPAATASWTRASIRIAAGSSITVPTSVCSSSGSPHRSARAPALTRCASSSAIALDRDDPLDRGAALAGVRERAPHGEPRRLLEVGVGEHDQRIVAAELEHRPAVAEPRGDRLADRDAAGERDDLDRRRAPGTRRGSRRARRRRSARDYRRDRRRAAISSSAQRASAASSPTA